MPGLTRKCREGEAFRVGEATIRVLRTGRKAVINITAPPHVDIEHLSGGVPGGKPGGLIPGIRDGSRLSLGATY